MAQEQQNLILFCKIYIQVHNISVNSLEPEYFVTRNSSVFFFPLLQRANTIDTPYMTLFTGFDLAFHNQI